MSERAKFKTALLRWCRRQKSLTASDMAGFCGVNPSTVSRWENPSISTWPSGTDLELYLKCGDLPEWFKLFFLDEHRSGAKGAEWAILWYWAQDQLHTGRFDSFPEVPFNGGHYVELVSRRQLF